MSTRDHTSIKNTLAERFCESCGGCVKLFPGLYCVASSARVKEGGTCRWWKKEKPGFKQPTERLAGFLLSRYGQLIKDEGACDLAIRLLLEKDEYEEVEYIDDNEH